MRWVDHLYTEGHIGSVKLMFGYPTHQYFKAVFCEYALVSLLTKFTVNELGGQLLRHTNISSVGGKVMDG